MTYIPAEPVKFIETIHEIMVKNGMIARFEIEKGAKVSFGATLAKWVKVDGELTEEQKNQSTRNVMAFIIGYHGGIVHAISKMGGN